MEKLWNWIIFASDRVDEKDQYCVRWFSNLYLIPSSQLSLMASHQQVTAISSLKYHFRASQCCETEQICKYALSSFQVLVLGELMRWNIANNANIQMMSLLIFKCFPLSRGKKRKRIRGKPLHKVFFPSEKSLERFETSPPDYLIVSTINHRFPETFRTSKFCNFVVVFL